MALNEFWISLRNAIANYQEIDVQTDSGLRWLTPDSLDGFDAHDFAFMPNNQQAALRNHVEAFLSVARQIPGHHLATKAQVNEARSAFEEILHVLKPYQFHDAESFRTYVLLNEKLKGKLPEWITAITCETGTDSLGDEAIWIHLDVTDEAVDKRKIPKHWQSIQEQVEKAYRQIGGRRYPFVRFRSPDAAYHKQVSK